MEILSTGEKIKRSRIYNGITLKELCSDKISISKMSCIENGKIKADKETLKYISEILKVDYDYLVKDVYEQIEENLVEIRKRNLPFKEMEEFICYNLSFAQKYGYTLQSFELTHILFLVYIDYDQNEKIQTLISNYYDLYHFSRLDKRMSIYYFDMGMFFMKTKEYHEAISYFARIRELYENNEAYDKETYVYASFYEGICYKNIGMLQEAYNVIKKVLHCVDEVVKKDKANFYHQFAMLNILLNKEFSDKYIEKYLEHKSNDLMELAKFNGEDARCYFIVGDREKAMIKIKTAIEIFPKDNNRERGEFLLKCIEILYENNEYEEAFVNTDEALNLAIDINDDILIERAYYFKGMIHQRQGQYFQAEMYMNLSTDLLFRFASNAQRYKRYNEMAELYYNLGEIKDSLKYFTLAINMEKKI